MSDSPPEPNRQKAIRSVLIDTLERANSGQLQSVIIVAEGMEDDFMMQRSGLENVYAVAGLLQKIVTHLLLEGDNVSDEGDMDAQQQKPSEEQPQQ